MTIWIGSSQRWDIDWVSNWLVTRRVDHVPQSLFSILDTSSFWITITQEDKLLLLSCPQATYTLLIDLQKPRREAVSPSEAMRACGHCCVRPKPSWAHAVLHCRTASIHTQFFYRLNLGTQAATVRIKKFKNGMRSEKELIFWYNTYTVWEEPALLITKQ